MNDVVIRCEAPTAAGGQCKRPRAPGEMLCHLHLRGMHTAYTPERGQELVAMFRAGTSSGVAARAVGVSERTLNNWIQRGARGVAPYADLAHQLRRARAQGEVRQVAQIATAAAGDKEKPGDWRASAWLIDRNRFDEGTEPLDVGPIARAATLKAREEAAMTLQSLGEQVELSSGAVDRYAAAVAAWAVLEAQWEHAGSPSTAPGGSTGTAPVAHPLLGLIAQARKEAAQLATLLGLDPLGRMRISRQLGAGRPMGAESSPDRTGPPRRRLRAV